MRATLYSGAGNSFLLSDNRECDFPIEKIPDFCSAADVDGVILFERSFLGDAHMRTFNRDGSEAEMCGNGLRCFVKFLKETGIEKKIYHIHTLAGVHTAWFEESEVCVKFPLTRDFKLNVAENLHFINTGVPHVVKFVDSVDAIDVLQEGERIRYSRLFQPGGANVNFAAIHKEGFLTLRTFERGVEGETLACGTGAIATALIAHALHYLSSPIDVWVRSGDVLKISFNSSWSEIILKGPAVRIKEMDFNLKTPIMVPL